MVGHSLWYLCGYVVIKVKGPRLERFVNAAVRQAGIALRDVERISSDMMVVTVSAAAFAKLRTLSRSGAWKITILRRVGLPFLLHKLLRRRGMVVGATLAFIVVQALSSFIWFVTVEGTDSIPGQRIMAIARMSGLHPGVAKRAFSGRVVERELLLALDRLAWVHVDVRGTLATIRVAEKAVPDEELTLPGDVVAARDGIIEELVILQGIPVVSKGDTVRAGQLLISGLIPPQDPAHGDKIAGGEPPYVRAHGIVKARVWHEGYAQASVVVREEVRTGRVHRRLVWRWHDYSGNLGAEAPFSLYQEHRIVLAPGIGRFRLPGSLSLETRHEIEPRFTALDPNQAQENALIAAWEQVQESLPIGAVIHQPPHVEVGAVNDGNAQIMMARVVVSALEDIKVFRPVQSHTSEKGVSRSVLGPPPRVQPVPGP